MRTSDSLRAPVERRLARRGFLGGAAAAVAAAVAAPKRASAVDGGKSPQHKPKRTAYRLSTRNNRHACTACRKHAFFRSYRTAGAADGDRAHDGCNCRIVPQRIAVDAWKRMFGPHHRTVFDARWTT